MAHKIDGRALQATLLDELKEETATFVAATGVTPGLVVMLVGDDPASNLYVSNKEKACAKVGILSLVDRIPADVTQERLIELLQGHNNDDNYHGIIVQLPLPDHIDSDAVVDLVAAHKDVDGLTSASAGKLMHGSEWYTPCTPTGVVEILKREGIETEGKHVVVVGRSNLVGKPLANLLLRKGEGGNATVTVVHSRTKGLEEHTRRADILVAAIGVPEFIKPDQVKEGAVIIDVGVNRIVDSTRKSGYRFVGDVDRETYAKASHYTPVPGGVGPLTVAMLLRNTVYGAKRFGVKK